MPFVSIVQKAPLPLHSLACQAFPYLDFADAYTVRLPSQDPDLTERFARTMFANPPAWVSLLMRLRDRIATVFGLKTAASLIKRDLENEKLSEGVPANSRLGFSVLKRAREDILIGEDDRHLDFRVSFMHSDVGESTEIRVVTAVKLNGWLGRLYLLPVKPLHKIIVPAMMKRAALTFSR